MRAGTSLVGVVALALVGAGTAPTSAEPTPALAVSGWGSFNEHQSQVPAALAARSVVAVSAGEEHSVALSVDGALTAWGRDDVGQASPPLDLVRGTVPVAAVDAGDLHGLAVLRDGGVRAWGAEGDADEGQTEVPDLGGPVVRVAAGRYHSLALTADGRVVGWGAEERHGDVDLGQADVPAALRDGSHNVGVIAAGAAHSLAVDEDGAIWAWGDDDQGQTDVPAAAEPAVAVAAYGAVSMALTVDGRVVAWGDAGTGTTAVPVELSGRRVSAIDVGAQVALALTADGRVVAWGDSASAPPAGIAARAPFSAIAAGGRHALVVHRRPPPPPAATRLTLTGPRQARAGSTVVLTLRLDGVRSGRVVVRDGSRVVRTLTVAGRATVRLRLAKGRHRLTASYAGTPTTRPARTPVLLVVCKSPRRR